MARYNVQKRRRLDNLAIKHNRRMRKVLRRDIESRVRDIFDALNAGEKKYSGDVKKVKEPIFNIFDVHQFDTVRAAVSDGIQEVTPNNELALWQLFDDDSCPILTLNDYSPQLAEKRDKIARRSQKVVKKAARFSLPGLTSLLLDDYLLNLRAGFTSIADGWIAGDDSVDDVLAMLIISFGRTDKEAKRIFTTETTNYFNQSRADYFIKQTGMDFMQIYSLADGRRSMICSTRHGWVFPIAQSTQKKKMPAFHPHCRTIQRPLSSRLKSHLAMIRIGLAMDESQFASLPKNWT